MAGEGNRATNEHVERWYRSRQRLERAQAEVRSAECELANAANALAVHLAPKDAAINEEFQIWVHTEELGMVEKERLVVVKKHDTNEFSVRWRGEQEKYRPIPKAVKAA